jgi:ABC-2 type transport system permease protein
MYKISSIENINKPKSFLKRIGVSLYNLGGLIELAFILFLWWLVFSKNDSFGDFSRNEMLTYLLFGNIIVLFSRYFLNRVMRDDLKNRKTDLFFYTPIKYFFKVILKNSFSRIIPFLFAVFLHLLVLYFFKNNLILNYNPLVLLLIVVIVFFSFITEFLIAYLFRIDVFWSIDHPERAIFFSRIRKFLAGNYIPLSLLPLPFLYLGLIFPFAYSFFVPTEIYLGKISLKLGALGLIVQIFWVIVLYLFVKMRWRKRKDMMEI